MENKLLMARSVPITTSHKPLGEAGVRRPHLLAGQLCSLCSAPVAPSLGRESLNLGFQSRGLSAQSAAPQPTSSCRVSKLVHWQTGLALRPLHKTISSPAGCLGSASAPRGQESQRTRWVSLGPQMRQPLTHLPGQPVVSATRY